MLGQVGPILGLSWAHVGPMLSYVGSMSAPGFKGLRLTAGRRQRNGRKAVLGASCVQVEAMVAIS